MCQSIIGTYQYAFVEYLICWSIIILLNILMRTCIGLDMLVDDRCLICICKRCNTSITLNLITCNMSIDNVNIICQLKICVLEYILDIYLCPHKYLIYLLIVLNFE